ncbi:hypothetical protein MNBD_GAMMA12-809 [hydrothermal vent metagenome]|uniref:Extracellular protein n=1 Tax=hydrothermal vent metagenome TaxID=652676 RepID=A0A3B0YZ88_9ZZZZ
MKIIKMSFAIIVLALFISNSSFSEKSAPESKINSLKVNRLSLDSASDLAMAAITACRKLGIQVGVTVVDRNGLVQITVRDTLAAPLTLKISRLKAYTAANFNVHTSQLARQAKSPLAQVDGLMMASGGMVIKVAGKLLGAIGVSGAPSGATDEKCANAGIKALASKLEMDL